MKYDAWYLSELGFWEEWSKVPPKYKIQIYSYQPVQKLLPSRLNITFSHPKIILFWQSQSCSFQRLIFSHPNLFPSKKSSVLPHGNNTTPTFPCGSCQSFNTPQLSRLQSPVELQQRLCSFLSKAIRHLTWHGSCHHWSDDKSVGFIAWLLVVVECLPFGKKCKNGKSLEHQQFCFLQIIELNGYNMFKKSHVTAYQMVSDWWLVNCHDWTTWDSQITVSASHEKGCELEVMLTSGMVLVYWTCLFQGFPWSAPFRASFFQIGTATDIPQIWTNTSWTKT